MASTVTLRDTTYGGSTTIALSVMQEGNDFGGLPNDGGPQVLSLRVNVTGTSADDREQDVRAIRRMLRDASDFVRQGLGKRVELVVQGNNVSVASVWDVVGGELLLEGQPFGFIANSRLMYAGLPLRLDVVPSSRSTESTVFTTATLDLKNGITHRYIHYSGATVFSENMAGLIDGGLFQRTLYGLAPSSATPQAGDIQYIGCALANFTELAFGIRTAGSGITWGVWQYWNGAWVTLPLLTNPFASGGNLFGTPTGWTQMTWAVPSDWATTTVNTVSARWIRAVVSSVSSPIAATISGPMCSTAGRGIIAPNAVSGDLPARPKIKLTNGSANPYAGVYAAIQTGRLTNAPGPVVVPLIAADVFTPSADITAAKVTDTGAVYGEAVEFTLAASLSDRGQTFDGSTQSATKAIGSGDKVDTMGTAGFFFEMAVKFDVVPSGPVPLISRWNTSNQVFWCGVDSGGRLKMMVYNSSGSLKIVRGTTPVEAGVWQTIGYEWAPIPRKIRVYLETGMQAEAGVGKAALRTAVTTALNLAHSVGFTSATDADDHADSEGYFDGIISYVWGEARTVDAIFGVGHYPSADDKRTTEGYALVAGTTTRVYYELDDTGGATTALVDTATGAGAALNFARTGFAGANTTVGYFQGGVGVEARALAVRIPLPIGREYAGRFLPILRARPTATLGSTDDIKMSVQFGPGDIDLPLHDSGLVFPDVGVPAAAGYYPLPMEPVTLPPADLAHYRSGEGARSYLQFDLFIQHAFITSTTMRVDVLILLPISDWLGEYQTFRDEYLSANAVAVSESFIFDQTGLYAVVTQTTSDGLTPERNAYQFATRGGPGIKPAYPAWLIAFPLRGSVTGQDHLESVNTDPFSGTLTVQPRSEGIAV